VANGYLLLMVHFVGQILYNQPTARNTDYVTFPISVLPLIMSSDFSGRAVYHGLQVNEM